MKTGFFITVVLVCLLSFEGWASVKTISVQKGQVVTQEAPTTPGFAALFEVPSEILSFSIADQTSFACDKIPSNTSQLICKPLTPSLVSTNLVISTAENEFNIILTVKDDGTQYPFKYVFSNGEKSINTTEGEGFSNKPSKTSSSLDVWLNDYKNDKCRLQAENQVLDFVCTDLIRWGTDTLIKFTLTNTSKQSIKVVKAYAVLQTMGGLTGLSLKKEQSIPVESDFGQGELSSGSEIKGVIKIPKVSVSEDQRLVLVIMSNAGEGMDLRMNISSL